MGGGGIFGHPESSEIYSYQNITIIRFSIYIITHAGARREKQKQREKNKMKK